MVRESLQHARHISDCSVRDSKVSNVAGNSRCNFAALGVRLQVAAKIHLLGRHVGEHVRSLDNVHFRGKRACWSEITIDSIPSGGISDVSFSIVDVSVTV